MNEPFDFDREPPQRRRKRGMTPERFAVWLSIILGLAAIAGGIWAFALKIHERQEDRKIQEDRVRRWEQEKREHEEAKERDRQELQRLEEERHRQEQEHEDFMRRVRKAAEDARKALNR